MPKQSNASQKVNKAACEDRLWEDFKHFLYEWLLFVIVMSIGFSYLSDEQREFVLKLCWKLCNE